MRSVKSLAQATQAAAQSGATLEVGGRLVNAGGAKLTVLRPKAAEPEPDRAPPEPDPLLSKVVELIDRLAASQARPLLQAAPVAPAPEPMRPVSFAVVRDSNGAPTALIPRYGPGRATPRPSFDITRDGEGLATEITPRY